MRHSNYGERGGDSPTAGRAAEMIEARVGGETFRKRVFKGQRWMVVVQDDEHDKPCVMAFVTEEQARNVARHSDSMVAMVLPATAIQE